MKKNCTDELKNGHDVLNYPLTMDHDSESLLRKCGELRGFLEEILRSFEKVYQTEKNMLMIKQEKLWTLIFPSFVLLCFLLRLIEGFQPGVLLSAVPDSVEPFVGALRMCRGEKFGFILNGEYFPSRYSPILSILLVPFLYFAPVPAAAGMAVGFWAMVLMVFVVLLFHKDKEYGGTALACGLLFSVPCFLEYCGSVMTEIPYSALLFIMLWLFRNMMDLEDDSPKLFLLYGLAAALCGSLRMTGYPMLLPAASVLFILCRRKKKLFPGSWLFLLVPSAITSASAAIFNWIVFGSPARSGYHFHTPVPYDFPEILFSFNNIPINILDSLKWGKRGLAIVGAALLFSGIYALLNKKRSSSGSYIFWAECGFVILQFGILVLLYYPHCYFAMRFFLPGILLFAWLLARSLLGVFRNLNISNALITNAAWLIGFEIMLITFFQPQQDYCGREIAALCRMKKALPEQALLIHDWDPGRVETFLICNSGKKQLPVTRKHEYADKIALRNSIRDPFPMPKHTSDHRAAYLHEAPGKIDFFPKVFEEAPQEILKERLTEKNPVFITGHGLCALSPEVYLDLRRRFFMQRIYQTPQGDALFQIFPHKKRDMKRP